MAKMCERCTDVLVPDPLEEKGDEQRAAGSREPEYRDRDELVVERTDPQQPGYRRPEQYPSEPGGLVSGQVHSGGAEDVASTRSLPSPARGGTARASATGRPKAASTRRPAPVVGRLRQPADEKDPDGLRERVVQSAPREDPGTGARRVGVRQIRVVDRVGRPEADRGDHVQEGERPHVVDERHERHHHRVDTRGRPRRPTLRLPRSAATAWGSPHAIWATAATNVSAPSPASSRWNEVSMFGPRIPRPLPTMSGMKAAIPNRMSGAVSVLLAASREAVAAFLRRSRGRARGRRSLRGPGCG